MRIEKPGNIKNPFFSKEALLLLVISVTITISSGAQEKYYFGCEGKLWLDSLSDYSCSWCIYHDKSFFNTDYSGGFSFDPDSTLYILSNNPPRDIHSVNLSNADATLVFDGPGNLVWMGGMVAMGGGIFYSIPRAAQPSDSLYRWDINAGTVSSVGQLSYAPIGELWLANGEMYYIGYSGSGTDTYIVKIDLSDPSDSEAIVTIPSAYQILALTASPDANVFVGADISYPSAEMITVNIIDGTISVLCDVPKQWIGHNVTTISSYYEHQNAGSQNYIDLDCDDNSMATGSDFNGLMFDCFNEGGVAVADTDIVIRIDDYIETMVFQVANPLDGEDEIFILAGPTPGIIPDGEGTPILTLYSEGAATVEHFKNALQQVRYDNIHLSPTGGTRVIEVSFETQSGSQSNIAHAFIEVIEHPQIQIDLGPDQDMCEGEVVTIEAGVYANQYEWSTGESTESIEVTEAGSYSVTVSLNNKCPNADTIEIFELPVANITLSGDTNTCEGETVTLILSSDASFPVNIAVTLIPGGTVSFNDVEGVFEFSDLPFVNTEYMITDVTMSEPSCIYLLDDYQFVTVNPVYNSSAGFSLCEGDSVLIGGIWQHESGTYPVEYQTIQGCDSVILYTVNISPTVNISIEEFNCDTSALGVFVTEIINPTGCDTILTTTVHLTPSDTTFALAITCRMSEAGTVQQIFSNQSGCDSIVITSISYTPPADTSLLSLTTCDSSQFGISFLSLLNVEGCDSIVMLEVTGDVPDTTYLQLTSCDTASLGVFDYHYTTTNGCDITVIATVTYAERDSIFLEGVSCDPANTGVFVSTFTNIFGCDSVVTETISLSASSEVFITGTTCDPDLAGLFIDTLVNQFGCDSVVHETISLLPASESFLSSTTCIRAEAGTFINIYPNQFGCDSVVTSIVEFIPGSQTDILMKTCDPAAVEITENIFIGSGGCDSVVTVTVELFPLPALELILTAGYNGFDISCFGENDGDISADVAGVGPFQYSWSNGSMEQNIANLLAGSYSLTVTDGNGCVTTSEVTLSQPELLSLSYMITEPDCIDQQQGVILLESFGGVGPIQYSIDGVNYQSSPIFESLPEGEYQITVLDMNGCEARDVISINIPLTVDVNLGDDQFVLPGDSAIITAIVNIPYDSVASIIWSEIDNSACQNCLTQLVAPIITTTFSVIVTSLDGCSDEDEITIFTEGSNEVFVPNIFSPNGDNVNDRFLINAGPSVKEISSLTIYDRWGNMVFDAQHFQPGDLSNTWDGKMNGKEMDPGVFAYMLIAELKGGGQIVRYGDVTIVR